MKASMIGFTAVITALGLAACGDDDRPAVDSGPVGIDSGPEEEDAGFDSGPELDSGPEIDSGPGVDSGPVSEPPVITMVEWAQETVCAMNIRSDVTVTTTVTDADTAAGSLTFTGMVSGCTGMIDGPTATVSCPQIMPYPSTVTVEDPEGNSDTLTFTIGVCMDGSMTP